jgi:phage terminase large subunit GpA-like protein
MDLCAARGIVQVNMQKGGQIGVSEATRNLICYWAHVDPDPIGLAFPGRDKGRETVQDHVIPAFQGTVVLTGLFTPRAWDIKSEKIRLTNGFLMHLMWAGSPASTSSEPIRRQINDEVDKPGFRDWGGAEPNPIGRTWTRLRTFGDRKLQINVSTPTNRTGNIFRLREGSNVLLEFRVPCPFCGAYQYLAFRQIRWDKPDTKAKLSKRQKLDLAAGIEADNAVWYECSECRKRIEPEQKVGIVRAGRWSSEDGEIEDAETMEEWPAGTRIGMKVGALPCLWESWASLAAEFIRAEGDRGKLYVFRTEGLGEPWEEQLEKTRPSLYAGKCERATLEEGQVPDWAMKLIASVDTQHDHFFAVVRAWGPDMRSQRVWHSRVETFEDLDFLCLKHIWPFAGDSTRGLRAELVLIDSGGTKLEGEQASRTMQVYRWALRRRSSVRAVKGAGAAKRHREGIYIWPGKGFLDEGRSAQKTAVRIWFLDTHHFADMLAELVSRGLAEDSDEEEMWLLNKQNDEEYNSHLANVHKIVVQEGSQLEERWIPIESGAPDHYWDCYDAETEVLTRRGWQFFRHVQATDALLTVNLEANRLEYQVPSHLIGRRYRGEMIQIGGQRGSRLDLCITPTHRMVVTGRGRPDRIVQASELRRRDLLKTAAAHWRGSLKLPETLAHCDPDVLARLVGWYVAEGYCMAYVHQSQPSSVKRRVVIYQEPGEKREALRTVLSRLPWRFHETKRGFTITNKQLHDELSSLGDAYTKRVPGWVRQAPQEIIRAFLDGAIAGDGWYQPCKHGRLAFYCTVSPGLADDMQELFVKAGFACSIAVKPAKPYSIRGRSGTNTRPMHVIRARIKKHSGLRNASGAPTWRRVPYSGMVYCATVPNGTLVVRRNGKAAICGNCEVYQIAGAYMGHVHMLPSAEELQGYREGLEDDRVNRENKARRRERTRPDPWSLPDYRKYV